MANLQSYIKEDSPPDNAEATVNGIDESKDAEDVNLIVSHSVDSIPYAYGNYLWSL